MKAWEVTNSRLALHDVEPPTAGAGEALLDVTFAGVCGSDIAKLRDPGAFDLPPVWRPGHEIVAVGPDGNLVAVDPLLPCGRCLRCTKGDTHLCPSLLRIGWDMPGGYADKVCVPVDNTHSIGKLQPTLAVLADPMAVAVHGLRCSRTTEVTNVAVIGAGAIGLLTAAYARTLGLQVTVIARHTPTVSLDGVRVCPAGGDIDTASFDLVVDAASGASNEPLETAIALVRDGGTIIAQNAYHPGVTMTSTLRDIFRRSLRIVGSFSFCRRDGSDFTIGLDVLMHIPEAMGLTKISTSDGLTQIIGSDSPAAVRHVLALA